MRKNLGVKTLFFPLPVLLIATYDEDGNPDIMNAAWGGIHDTNQVHLCLDLSHKTSENILKNPEFSIAFADKEHLVESDYVGIVSLNKNPDKIKKSGLKIEKCENINAPLLTDFGVSLECRVQKMSIENNTLYIVANIVNVSVDEKALTNDKIDISKLGLISFNPADNTYVEVGQKVGNAFKDGLKLR